MTNEERKKKQREYYLQNKERFRENHRRWCSKNKEKLAKRNAGYVTEWILKKKYGIDGAEYNRLFTLQSGRCAICLREASEFKRKLAVDHNHTTGQVRGLLCVKCNRGIGCFEEISIRFDAAREYLLRFT